MSQSDNRVPSSGRGSRLIRRLILAFVIVLVVGGVYFVRTQMMNSVTLANNSSEPMTFGHVVIQSKNYSSGEWVGSTPLVKDHVMQPNTRLTFTFSGRRHGRVAVLKRWSSKGNTMVAFTVPASWGTGWTIGWDAENKAFCVGDSSTLRRWFNWINPKLPLPASWRE